MDTRETGSLVAGSRLRKCLPEVTELVLELVLELAGSAEPWGSILLNIPGFLLKLAGPGHILLSLRALRTCVK